MKRSAKWFVQVLSLFVLVLFLAGCATVQVSTVKTRKSYKQVWNACLDSLPDILFAASSTDSKSGLIIADRAVVGGHGTVDRMNIRLQKGSSGTVVNVKYIPAPGAVGGYGNVDRYIKALKEKIPDLETVVTK